MAGNYIFDQLQIIMKGFVPVEISTKKYIRAFLINQLGDKPVMTTSHVIGNKFLDLLQRSTNEYRKEFATAHYNTRVQVYVSLHTFRQRGSNLNETDVKGFNRFLELLLKDQLHFLLDIYVPKFNSFEKALVKVREFIMIDDDDWETDSIKKDYYRYRLKNNRPLLYRNKLNQVLPEVSF